MGQSVSYAPSLEKQLDTAGISFAGLERGPKAIPTDAVFPGQRDVAEAEKWVLTDLVRSILGNANPQVIAANATLDVVNTIGIEYSGAVDRLVTLPHIDAADLPYGPVLLTQVGTGIMTVSAGANASVGGTGLSTTGKGSRLLVEARTDAGGTTEWLVTHLGLSSASYGRQVLSTADRAAFLTLLGYTWADMKAGELSLPGTGKILVSDFPGFAPVPAMGFRTAAMAAYPVVISSIGVSFADSTTQALYGTISGVSANKLSIAAAEMQSTANPTTADSFTRKAWITPPVIRRAVAIAYAAAITPNADTTDVVNVGTLTGNITINAPSGTPVDSQELTFRFVQDATGTRTYTWNAAFAFGTDVTAAMCPTTANAKFEITFRRHTGDAKWRAVSIVRGF